jgi:hypothetical protein
MGKLAVLGLSLDGAVNIADKVSNHFGVNPVSQTMINFSAAFLAGCLTRAAGVKLTEFDR